MLSFNKLLIEEQPSIFFVEETKFRTEGKLNLKNYKVFECVRQNTGGGGILIGAMCDLYPIWLRDGGQEVDALSVQIRVRSLKIRCCVAYGVQENHSISRKELFWSYLQEDVNEARKVNNAFILHFDGNLWAGSKIIPGDPRPQNRNGKMFENFLSSNPHLTVVNSLKICEGLLTRVRMRKGKMEGSVLDFFVVCSKLLPHVTKMKIDNEKRHILTNYKNMKNDSRAIDSDHLTQFLYLKLQHLPKIPERELFYDFKDPAGIQKFMTLTSNNSLSNIFMREQPIHIKTVLWEKCLENIFNQSFKKIRKRKHKKYSPKISIELSQLIDKRNSLLSDNNDQQAQISSDVEEIRSLEEKIYCLESKIKRNEIFSSFSQFNENPEKIIMDKMWNFMEKICPKFKQDVPVAKYNHQGILITEPDEMKKLLASEFKERFRTRPERPDLVGLMERKMLIFKLLYKLSSGIQCPDFQIRDLEKALSDLKNKKSRDPQGYVNEVFKPGIIGNDLKQSLLYLFNSMKNENFCPEFMRLSNVTPVPKSGSKLQLSNMRGINRVTVIRSVYLRMIYNLKYEIIDQNMTEYQSGGRKGRGCRNNIFIVNGLIYDAVKSKRSDNLLIQIYDNSQMFDSLNLEQIMIDAHTVGLQDQLFNAVYEVNKVTNIAVKTQEGLSEREGVKSTVLQGDTMASILASTQSDNIMKGSRQEGYHYQYKGVLSIGYMIQVDDTIGFTKPGYLAHMLNSYINIKTAEKMLQFNPRKCKVIFVGCKSDIAQSGPLTVDSWKVEHQEDGRGGQRLVETYEGKKAMEEVSEWVYLGCVISNQANNLGQIRNVKNKSIGTIRKIFGYLVQMKLGNYYFECSLIFDNVILRSSILYASETLYNLTETETRQIERIEESYLRQVMKTGRTCPLSEIYLSVGQRPVRYEITRRRLLFLKYILNQDENSITNIFLNIQLKHKRSGDWVSNCQKDIESLKLYMSFQQIKEMKITEFKKVLFKRINEHAFSYLMSKRKSKGTNIIYKSIQMSDYLLPNEVIKNINDKQLLFSLKNDMYLCTENKFTKKLCLCGTVEETLSHLYICTLYNDKKQTMPYDKIYNGSLEEQNNILQTMKDILNKRTCMMKKEGDI